MGKRGVESLSGAMQGDESDPTLVMSKERKKRSAGGVSSVKTLLLVVAAD